MRANNNSMRKVLATKRGPSVDPRKDYDELPEDIQALMATKIREIFENRN